MLKVLIAFKKSIILFVEAECLIEAHAFTKRTIVDVHLHSNTIFL